VAQGATFTIRFQQTPSGLESTFTQIEVDHVGKKPSLLLPGVELLNATKAPDRLVLMAEHGPLKYAEYDCHDETGLVTDACRDVVAALHQIQLKSTTRLTMPKPNEFTARLVNEITRAAALLNDESFVECWDTVPSGRTAAWQLALRHLRLEMTSAGSASGWSRGGPAHSSESQVVAASHGQN